MTAELETAEQAIAPADAEPGSPTSSIAPEPASASTEGTAPAADGEPAAETAGGIEGEALPAPTPHPDPAAEGESPVAETAGDGPSRKPKKPPAPLDPRLASLREASAQRRSVKGRVIGWNRGGFHVVVEGITCFCPHSEMALPAGEDPAHWVDQELEFGVLAVRPRSKRVVLSRRREAAAQRQRSRAEALETLEVGQRRRGPVVGLTDFGAFVDLGGIQGLIHRSEISHAPVTSPAAVLELGQEVEVQILSIEEAGRRIGLSMRALEPDPWKEAATQLPIGETVEATVVQVDRRGAILEVLPGVRGLLPVAAMAVPVESTPARAYPVGKRVPVQVTEIDARRQRVSLVREGAQMGGSEADFRAYRKQQKTSESGGFTALAAALQRLRDSTNAAEDENL